MASNPFNFTTGPSLLPSLGVVHYNGCNFSPLFATTVTGDPVKDEANRTVKYTRLTIEVDGYVTLAAGASDISDTMAAMHALLTAQGGRLKYLGRGFDFDVDGRPNGTPSRDLAWGPIPELIEFQPLGAGRSAKVKWKVQITVSPRLAGRGFRTRKAGVSVNLLQFNFETTIDYDEDGFSSLSLTGTLEIPLARNPTQATRTIDITADDAREVIFREAMSGVDMALFTPKRRHFTLSKDKRTVSWDISYEEKSYMDLPPNSNIARGTFNFKPSRAGPGLCMWLCTLTATYNIRADMPRRQAWLLFLALLRLRMAMSEKGNIPNQNGGNQARPNILNLAAQFALAQLTNRPQNMVVPRVVSGAPLRRAVLIDFHGNEGIYKDSKTVTFSASWRLCTTFSHILVASGLWTKLNEGTPNGENLWATSMANINGTSSWLQNAVDPAAQVIIDFGSEE